MASEAAPDADEVRLKRLVDDERVREIYGRPGTNIYAGPAHVTIVVLMQGLVLWPVNGGPHLLAWLGMMLLIEAGIVTLLWTFHRQPRPAEALPFWGRAKTIQAAIHGLGWSAQMLMTYEPSKPLTLLAIVIANASMAAGNLPTTGVHLPSMTSFSACALLPAAVFALLRTQDPTALYAAYMLVLTFVLVMSNGSRASKLAGETIRLRLAMAEQVDLRRRLQEDAEEGRRMAEAASAERTRFFGAASHDLRQPVHALGLYASLLRRDPPARERRELIANVVACVDSLDRLFNAILGVTRASRLSAPELIGPTPLADIIARLMLQYRPEAEAKGLKLRAPVTSLWARGDPAAIERILGNLVANAIRYTKTGGVVVGARRQGEDVALIVADTGVGIADADRTRVFAPFFQVENTGRDRAAGFGLGLATVRELCLAQGYAMDLQSEPGRGSVFSVVLPRADAMPSTPAPTPALVERPDRPNVLLVEDDPLVADAVRRLLTDWGMRVHVCVDGEGALEALEAGGRWNALIDYRLAGKETGLDIARSIRTRHGDAIGLSLITGESDPVIFAAAEHLGMRVLQKPLKPIRLRALLSSETYQASA
ncbi:hybrid sensor histidine kinase/response regulator [Caulobacter sp.]|uniref:hybrid sensor histidine kinase/response regulator n=1 Tax=Caulobacter sp. TaxID=78 RepID=UPI001B155029|nr:hybrid sensor histidine kinase/response regulator [Caulobacter sp.]MBO9543485.1 response regulator [Caulobacter sp.]